MFKENFLFIIFFITPYIYANEPSLDKEGNPIPISHYNINNDQLLSDEVSEQEMTIWNRFTQVIPKKYRPEIKEFEPIDGNSGIDGSIHTVSDDNRTWVVQLDTRNSVSKHNLDRTMIHEFAHLLTLRIDQIPAPLDDDEEVENSCSTYYLKDGCTNKDSYLNQFVLRFWEPHLPIISDEKSTSERFKNYKSEFVTEYAATNPAEDIAESFAEYVLTKKLPKPTSISNSKIVFFEQYSKLREIKKEIRIGLNIQENSQ